MQVNSVQSTNYSGEYGVAQTQGADFSQVLSKAQDDKTEEAQKYVVSNINDIEKTHSKWDSIQELGNDLYEVTFKSGNTVTVDKAGLASVFMPNLSDEELQVVADAGDSADMDGMGYSLFLTMFSLQKKIYDNPSLAAQINPDNAANLDAVFDELYDPNHKPEVHHTLGETVSLVKDFRDRYPSETAGDKFKQDKMLDTLFEMVG